MKSILIWVLLLVGLAACQGASSPTPSSLLPYPNPSAAQVEPTTPPNVVYPPQITTFNETQEAVATLAAKSRVWAEMELTLTAQPTTIPPSTLSPQEIATLVQGYKDRADITFESKGQTFTYAVGTRFFVFLDDEKYPVNSLVCEPEWVMGRISNGSFRGPDVYPIYFEAARPGSCILKSNDFWVKIMADWTSVTPTTP